MFKQDDLHQVTVEHLRLDARKGTTLDRCLYEAVYVAFREHVPVVLYFSDKAYVIDPKDVMNYLLKENK